MQGTGYLGGKISLPMCHKAPVTSNMEVKNLCHECWSLLRHSVTSQTLPCVNPEPCKLWVSGSRMLMTNIGVYCWFHELFEGPPD